LLVEPGRCLAVDLHRDRPRLEAPGGLGNPSVVVHGKGRADIVDLSEVFEHVQDNGPELRQSDARTKGYCGGRHHDDEHSRTNDGPAEQVA
jgi:hypothetical protein